MAKVYVIEEENPDVVLEIEESEIDPEIHVRCPRWIRRQSASRALKIYYGSSRAEAVKAHCLECVGGSSKEVRECPVFDCPLWTFRPGAKRRVRIELPPGVPSRKALEALASEDPKSRGASERLAEYRKKKGASGPAGSKETKQRKGKKTKRLPRNRL